jgi:hypothetical protein
MAKPTTYATPICIVLTIAAALGIVLGVVTEEPLWTIALLAPSVGYEAYRTEGESTRWASWAMAALIVALLVMVVADVEFDLRELLGQDSTTVGDEQIPLGDVKVVFPAAMAALSLLLWTRTRGVYTRWLAAIILAGSVALVYVIAPDAVGDLFGSLGG